MLVTYGHFPLFLGWPLWAGFDSKLFHRDLQATILPSQRCRRNYPGFVYVCDAGFNLPPQFALLEVSN